MNILRIRNLILFVFLELCIHSIYSQTSDVYLSEPSVGSKPPDYQLPNTTPLSALDEINKRMKIVLVMGHDFNDVEILLYEGLLRNSIVSKIHNTAQPMTTDEITLERLPEGKYILEVTDYDQYHRYVIGSDDWIYETTRHVYYKCSLLSILRGYFINYLLGKTL